MCHVRLTHSPGRLAASGFHCLRTLLVGLSLLLGPGALAEEEHLPPPLYYQAAQTLVRIEAEGCPSPRGIPADTRISQGIIHGEPGQIVTVLHGIAGCQTVRVSLFSGENQEKPTHTAAAWVVKLLPEADLALLQLEGLPAGSAWPQSLTIAQPPPPDSDIFAIARWNDAAAPRDKKLRVAYGSRQLSHIVDGPARQELEQRQSPSLTQEIVNIDGTINPGSSGAPIIDTSGRLVAIADGGLSDGLVQINWAIPAREFPALFSAREASREEGARYGQGSASLFAAEFEFRSAPRPPPVLCGNRELNLIREVGIEELLGASDDPLGGLQLLLASDMDHSRTRFDVYQDYESGAAIAVPVGAELLPFDGSDGAQLSALGDFCYARTSDGQITLVLGVVDLARQGLAELSGPEDLDALMKLYDLGVSEGQLMDEQFAYPSSQAREDGLYTQRAVLTRHEPEVVDVDAPAAEQALPQVVYTTMAARGSTVVLYSALFMQGNQDEQLLELLDCLGNQAPDSCGHLLEQQTRLEQTLLAVHLTTFPP